MHHAHVVAIVTTNIDLRGLELLLVVEVRCHVWIERGNIWHLGWSLHEWGLHLSGLILNIKVLFVRLLLRSFKLVKACLGCRVHWSLLNWLICQLSLVNEREQLSVFSLDNLCHCLVKEIRGS